MTSHKSHSTLQEALAQGTAPWDNVAWSNDYVTVFRDRYPVTPGHCLFVPRSAEAHMIHRALAEAQMQGNILLEIGDCDGYNIGLNMGRSAGQTVMYPHVHLIPRRTGDCVDPTGGVRGVIPKQQNYKTSTYQTP